ncbi:MAG: uroporphyrinogen-III synthase, partial [Gammaproteobacteria bacterium]
MRASPAGPLHGLGVLVTRPAHQAQGLQRLIEAAGGRAFLFPLLDIKPLNDPSRALSWIRDLARYEIAVFVSANAVEHGLGLMALHGGTLGAIGIIAVGRATARRLEERGIAGAAVPSVASSEGVLRLDTLGT